MVAGCQLAALFGFFGRAGWLTTELEKFMARNYWTLIRSCLAGSMGALAVVLLAPATSAMADASLVRTNGEILVNTGDGFQKPMKPMALKGGDRMIAADQPMTLRAGDRVLVSAKSSAGLRYADGCEVPLKAGQLVTISTRSPCSFKACTPTASGGCAVLASNAASAAPGAISSAVPGAVTASSTTLVTVATAAAPAAIGAVTATVATLASGDGEKDEAVKKFASP